MSDPNVSGQAYALTVMTPIQRGQEDSLRSYLESLPRRDSPLAKLPGTHFGRWVIVTELDLQDLDCQYLVFTSNFDGPLHAYLDELCSRLAPEAREIWGRCAGAPRGAAGPELKDYLLRHQVKTGVFAAAYGQATLPDVKRSLDRRERLIDFAVTSQGTSPSELQAAFDEEFRT